MSTGSGAIRAWIKRGLTDQRVWERLRLDRLATPFYAGLGTIIALHRVRPSEYRAELDANRQLEITPDQLGMAIRRLRDDGYDLVSLDEACERIRTRQARRRFAVFTLDDGYADALHHAYPVFLRHEVPFTLYLATGFPDGTAVMWWYMLEDFVVANEEVRWEADGTMHQLRTVTMAEKNAAFSAISPSLAFASEADLRRRLALLEGSTGPITADAMPERALTWAEVVDLARGGLATIGSHTVRHVALSRLPELEVRSEVLGGITRILEKTGQRPRHFAYPYGGRAAAGTREFELVRECGVISAVTTRHGNVFPGHAASLHALPRVGIHSRAFDRNGASFRLWTSGLVAARENRFRRVIVD